MATASAPSLRSDLPVRKPALSEPALDTHSAPLIRQAFGADVVGSKLSPRAQLGYRVLVDHVNRGRDPRRPYDGQVFLTDETFAAELGGVSKRQVQRIRSELLAGAWICLPKGDAGGRGNATIFYHLHPDGRPCAIAAEALMKQRAAAGQANQRRAATRKQQSASVVTKDDKRVILSGSGDSKDDTVVVLSPAAYPEKDDIAVVLSAERMTESIRKDDKIDVKDDKSGGVYKEELFQELTPELRSTATGNGDEFPPEFAQLMDQELTLDDGALRRLWHQARAILPDASAEEIRLSFRRRALSVYRNRKLDNPTGLMLATVRDWFSRRRVLEQRKALEDVSEDIACLERHVAEQLAQLRWTSTQPEAVVQRRY